jgi:hypothetical protein
MASRRPSFFFYNFFRPPVVHVQPPDLRNRSFSAAVLRLVEARPQPREVILVGRTFFYGIEKLILLGRDGESLHAPGYGSDCRQVSALKAHLPNLRRAVPGRFFFPGPHAAGKAIEARAVPGPAE